MDNLDNSLVDAHRMVNWFALGEAKRLAEKISSTVRSYRKNKNEPMAQKALTDVAKESVIFLRQRAIPEAMQAAQAVQSVLDSFEETKA